MLGAGGVGREHRIGRHFGRIEHFAQARKLVIGIELNQQKHFRIARDVSRGERIYRRGTGGLGKVAPSICACKSQLCAQAPLAINDVPTFEPRPVRSRL